MPETTRTSPVVYRSEVRIERVKGPVRRAYLPAEETNPVRDRVRELARVHGIRDRRRITIRPDSGPRQMSLEV